MTHRVPTLPLPGGYPPLGIAISGTTELLVVSQAGLFTPLDDGNGWRNLLEDAARESEIIPTAVTISANDRIIAGVIGGVMISDDSGVSWQIHPFRAPAPAISALAIAPDDRIVLAATLEDGVFRSEDGGEHWTAWNFGLFDRCVLDLALSARFPSDSSVLALTGSGCFISLNSGKTWSDLVLLPDVPELAAICATGAGWLGATPVGDLYRIDAAGNVETRPACSLHGEIIALLRQNDAITIAVTSSGEVIGLDTELLPVHHGVSTPRADAFITCAVITGSSVLLGWSDGGVTTIRN